MRPVTAFIRRNWFQGLVIGIVLLVATMVVASIRMFGGDAKPERQIALFDASPPNSLDAYAALDYANKSGFTTVINYSAINANGGPAGADGTIDKYLTYADSIDIKVVPSIHFLLGPADLDHDPQDQAYHRQFGASTADQAAEIVKELSPYPAVDGFLITDELPEAAGSGQTETNTWLPILKEQYKQLRALTDKRLMAVFYWTGDPSFYQQVQSPGQDLMVDYYPYPVVPGQTYGTIDAIPNIAGVVWSAAGPDPSWFVLQGFSWSKEPDTAAHFGFGDNPPAPQAGDIVNMAQKACQGGIRNLAIFDYPYIKGTPQEQEVAKAVAGIRAAPGCNR